MVGSLLAAPERAVCEAVKMESKLQLRKYIGDSKNMEPSKASGSKQSSAQERHYVGCKQQAPNGRLT
jgi:hypothetical protein